MKDNGGLKEKTVERKSAILLKDLGFFEPVYDYYMTLSNSLYVARRDVQLNMYNYNESPWVNRISAPTKNQVQLWLIKNYDIHISNKKNPTRNKINENSIFALNLEKTLRKILKQYGR